MLSCKTAGDETIPKLVDEDCMIHQHFICRGRSLPLHNFVHGLLYFYGCQLHRLTPNAILHVTNFIMLYECFLSTGLHFELFCYFFKMKVQKNGGEVCDCGGANLQLHPVRITSR